MMFSKNNDNYAVLLLLLLGILFVHTAIYYSNNSITSVQAWSTQRTLPGTSGQSNGPLSFSSLDKKKKKNHHDPPHLLNRRQLLTYPVSACLSSFYFLFVARESAAAALDPCTTAAAAAAAWKQQELDLSSYSPGKIPFEYSKDWKGTMLSPLLSLEAAVAVAVATTDTGATTNTSTRPRWPMARWPDPILRRAAKDVESKYIGTELLRDACQYLENTAINEKAVGLAAEQCGIDARIIYLKETKSPSPLSRLRSSLTMVNPRIVYRSPEEEMLVWREHCLVLPPTFEATVLRDAKIVVEYQSIETGAWERIRLSGEPARAFQHEFDHDRGILITDQVGFEEMDSKLMASIERNGHESRMSVAYSRRIDEAFTTA